MADRTTSHRPEKKRKPDTQENLTLDDITRIFLRHCCQNSNSSTVPPLPANFKIQPTEESVSSSEQQQNIDESPTTRRKRPGVSIDFNTWKCWWEDAQDPNRDRNLLSFIKEICKYEEDKILQEKFQRFRFHYSQVQQGLSVNNNTPRVFPQLPSTEDPPILHKALVLENNTSPLNKLTQEDDSSKQTQRNRVIQYLDREKGRNEKGSWTPQVIIRRPLRIIGAHPPWPKSTTTIFLKNNYSVEDATVPTHVPYFGDDDDDDVISHVFDLQEWKQKGLFGPDYQKVEDDLILDQVLSLLIRWTRAVAESLHHKMTEDNDLLEQIMKRLRKHLASALGLTLERVQTRYSVIMNPPLTCPMTTEQHDMIDIHKQSEEIKAITISNVDWDYSTKYSTLMDTYRALFCRRCFAYDCNNHGTVYAPSLDFQTELAYDKEKRGLWNYDASLVNTSTTPDVTLFDKAEMSKFHQLLLKRANLIFQGDVCKISRLFQCNVEAVERSIQDQRLHLNETIPDNNQDKWKKLKSLRVGDNTSLSQYDKSVLKRAYNAEIRPSFLPCDHGFESCNNENCSCVQSALLCTKHCALGSYSRNFFRGCSCKNGGCRTVACSCFALGRECDPDLCLTCGTCSDPPNERATVQQCRNDNISMRRHCHLIIGPSTIKEAGWGVFSKDELKRGDFVHEYVGESISQEEAERRGVVYDKINRSYLFNICSDLVLDATKKGNKTKFINHSSEPNCVARIMLVNGDTRVGIFTKRDIAAQKELFFDYRYDSSVDNDYIMKPAKTMSWMHRGTNDSFTKVDERKKR